VANALDSFLGGLLRPQVALDLGIRRLGDT
jgi:hypothetical protein